MRLAGRTPDAVRWPQRSDLPGVAGLGICYFGLFFVFYNIAMSYTTAARASLALSTLPLQTMLVGVLLGIEPLTTRKTAGVLIAMLGVFAALASGLSAGSCWCLACGELIMTGAVLWMASSTSGPGRLLCRSSPLGYLTVGMGAGAARSLIGTLTGRVAVLSTFGPSEWIAGAVSAELPVAPWRLSSGCWRFKRPARRGSPRP